MKKKSLMLFAAALCCLVPLAHAQTIGVYLDTAGTVCNGQTAGGIIQGSIWVNLAGAAANGITGAEFRVDPTQGYRGEFYTNYTVNVTQDTQVFLGNPFVVTNKFVGGGTNMTFTSCQTGARVRLMTFTIVETEPTNDIWLNVRQHAFPKNASFKCPLLTLCDAPAYTKLCVGQADSSDPEVADPIHWYAVVNPNGGVQRACDPVAVALKTWSEVKSLYHN
jgi:hypothetical protein